MSGPLCTLISVLDFLFLLPPTSGDGLMDFMVSLNHHHSGSFNYGIETAEEFVFLVEGGYNEIVDPFPEQNCSREYFSTNSAVIQFKEKNAEEKSLITRSVFQESVIIMIVTHIPEIFLRFNAFSDHLNSTRSLKMLIMISSSKKDQDASNVKREIEESSVSERQQLQQHFNIRSRIYIAFYRKLTTKSSNSEFLNAEIWDLYFIKDKIFMHQVLQDRIFSGFREMWKVISIDAMEPAFLRRQNWNGVELHCSFFLLESPKDEKEIEKALETGVIAIDRFEVNAATRKDGSAGLELLPSLSAKIFWDFQASLNFTYILSTPFGFDKGLQDAYNDHNRTFDIILSHFGIVPEKLMFAQHLLPTYFNGIEAVFVQPPIHSIRNIFSRPLSPGMWVMIATSWLLLIISFKLILWLRALLQLDFIEEDKEIDEKVGKDIWWWAIAAACQQGWYITPVSLPTRLVFITGLGFSLLCYASYTAEIVSQLWGTNQPISDIDTLMSFTNEILMGEDQDVTDMIKQRMACRNNFMAKLRQITTKDAVERILKTNRGYSCYLGWSDYFIDSYEATMNATKSSDSEQPYNMNQEYCKNVYHFKFKYLPIQVSMFVRKNSPYTETFNHKILSGREKGFIQRYWREYMLNTNIFCFKESNTTYALGLWDTWAAFAILVLGYGISISILILEVLKKRGLENVDFNMIM